MALSNTYDTTNEGSAVSNHEELTGILSTLAPEDTPALSLLDKQKANATFTEFTVDRLSAPVTTGIAESADVVTYTDKFAGRARLGNYCQIFRRDYAVSNLQAAVNSVGPAKFAQAEAKAVREIKRDIEATILSTNDRSVEDGAGSVYGLRGLGDWLDSAGPADVPEAYRTPAGSIQTDCSANYNEADLLNKITSIYRVTGKTENLTLIADTTLRRTTSDFQRLGDQTATIRNVNYVGGSTEISVSVEMYKSDHGMISIVNGNTECMPTTTVEGWAGYLINPEYAGIHELIPLSTNTQENAGAGERGYVDCTLTLGCYHPGAHGKFTD